MAASQGTSKQKEVQRIMDVLARAIAQHRLPPGTRLIEAQIVDTLKANRNHVQSALQRLALQKIVTIEPNRGAHVSQPSAREARDIFAARRAIERGVVEAITPVKIEQHRKRIDAHMAAEREATRASDRRAIVRELSEFHRMLGEVSGNEVLVDILENLMVRSSLIVALYQRNDVPSCQHDEHGEILDALSKGDNDLAVARMRYHLDHLESELALDDEAAPEVNLKEALASIG
ncbi:GntR family transcriptional regulator [Marinobacter nanhaiticus D15-8W]|uniref:GntR family transcriptional regulator n=1 Tax=Marinobacter nanhaiticus D15-8W TaxID=626887 RepID=N6VX36_9GAMM|nr:GntR family transcriptional regulator [Marinobacter nanhaiticus]ENO14800.1 GntR family transcriptional regulator [Marinobacter nanhaiticus D15-8W]BES69511.1 GntR family transcriptional regulator [Marinobacter nanhaiticus D15-8W]